MYASASELVSVTCCIERDLLLISWMTIFYGMPRIHLIGDSSLFSYLNFLLKNVELSKYF